MMQSSHNNGKEDVSFFTSLRRLGREIDQGVKEIQKQLDGQLLACENKKHVALKGLLDRRKEMDTLKSNSRTLVSEMRQRGKKFDQSLQVCSELIDLQLQHLHSLQTHLMQYGFVTQPECDDSAEKAVQETKADELESSTTPTQKRETKEEVEKMDKLSPGLEDFGVSSFTLNMLNQHTKPASFKVPIVAVPVRPQTRNEALRLNSVPDVFRNEGLTVSPSLFPAQSFDTGDRPSFEAFSPVMMSQGHLDHSEVDGDLQDRPSDVAKTLDFSDSPVPPVLQTPGIKQIPCLGEIVFPPPGERGSVARQLKPGDSVGVREDEGMDSPVPPVLSTPGIQQISSRTSAAHPSVNKTCAAQAGVYNPLDMPRTPDLTFSLKELEDMTVSFKHSDLSSTFCERSATISSYLDTSKSTQFAAQQGAPDRRAQHPPATSQPHRYVTDPKLPDCTISDYITARLAVSEPQLSSWSREGVGADGLELPSSPELTMSYSTYSKATTAATQPSTTFTSHPHTVHKHLEGPDWGEVCGGKGLLFSSADNTLIHQSQIGALSNMENEQCDMKSGLLDKFCVPPAKSACVSVYSSNTVSTVPEAHSGVLCSTENKLPPVTSEVCRKESHSAKGHALQYQPALHHQFTDGTLDLPATPKFWGTYHFMGSHH
ncbi:uncharacterized protein LOC143298204 isoform X2 [Babylonia areolata]|uniref:uncharacterized protein LOC143298204 isoform X2 n=1 Tax=Babylonia areolata TaxID=304850 RepID=UPI003FD20A99